jgi:peptide deformylase
LSDMFDTMYESAGIGRRPPGGSESALLLSMSPPPIRRLPDALVNPEIVGGKGR